MAESGKIKNAPIITFFNNKGGVGKTSLVYHLAWMLSEMQYRVLICDLDPQANLTAMCLSEERLESLFNTEEAASNGTVMKCLRPLTKVGDLEKPALQKIGSNLFLIPGDLALSSFEDTLSDAWPKALEDSNLYRPFRILTAFYTVMQMSAKQEDVDVILVDVGPNLGAINRSALIATDYLVVPLGADLFSLQGLRNLGPTLRSWRQGWKKRRGNWEEQKKPEFPIPEGRMQPIGYVVQRYSVRRGQPVRAYDQWINRIPKEYAGNLLEDQKASYPINPSEDRNALATVKHYRSLIPMGQEAHKPIFHLTPGDGAIGSHAAAAADAKRHFKELAEKIADKAGLPAS